MTSMKKILRSALFAAVAAVAGANAAQAALPIEHWTLASGAKIYLVSTQALPIVDVQIDFDAGSRRDPAAQAGLASATATMVEKGVRAGKNGEPALDENALGEAWADLGAEFNASAGTDRASYSLRTLSDPALLAKVVALASREIGEPAFPDDIWPRERERINASLKEANTKPATIAGRAFAQGVYGIHPYGQQVTEATLARIDTAAMRQRYQQLIVPCRAKLSIVGAVTRAEAEAMTTALLSRLPGPESCTPLPVIAPVTALAAPKDERIPFASAQAHVFIGQPGYPRKDPDHFALTLGNYVLGGGGFVSRLQRLFTGAGCRCVPRRFPDAARPGRGSRQGFARRGREVRGRRSDRRRAQGREGQPDRRLSALAGQQPQAHRQCGQHRVVRLAARLSRHMDRAHERGHCSRSPRRLCAQAPARAHGHGGGGRETISSRRRVQRSACAPLPAAVRTAALSRSSSRGAARACCQ